MNKGKFLRFTNAIFAFCLFNSFVLAGGEGKDHKAAEIKHITKKIAGYQKELKHLDKYSKEAGQDTGFASAVEKKKKSISAMINAYKERQSSLKEGGDKYGCGSDKFTQLHKESFNANHEMHMYKKAMYAEKESKYYNKYSKTEGLTEHIANLQQASAALADFYRSQATNYPELWKCISTDVIKKENELKLARETVKADLEIAKKLSHYKKKVDHYKDIPEVKSQYESFNEKCEALKKAMITKAKAHNEIDLLHAEMNKLNDDIHTAASKAKRKPKKSHKKQDK
ncbi:MAG: hypothetical protein ACYTFY_01485 [Planctomycetota bacterium]|jgi:hypothetical protein